MISTKESEFKSDYNPVQYFTVSDEQYEQRIDNFLMSQLNGVPKSLIYRIIRKGEVRVNRKRIKPEYKIQVGDQIRIPPVRYNPKSSSSLSPKLNQISMLEHSIIYEDDDLLAINKPSGIAVHGGSGLSFGVIEAFRSLRPSARYLELVHRIDRDTSGVLVIAKKRSALKTLHQQLQNKTIHKSYLALVKGKWSTALNKVEAPLLKIELPNGDRMVKVNISGKKSETRFSVVQLFKNATLIKAHPITGRTHQIRVHTQHAGHPIAFDSRYGDANFDLSISNTNCKRLFLHAYQMSFHHPKSNEAIIVTAELSQELKNALTILSNQQYRQGIL